MTLSALLVLHEGAQKIEKEAVVLGYLSDQWPVKVTIIRGVGFWRARGNAGPLSGGPHPQGARVNLDTVFSTNKPTTAEATDNRQNHSGQSEARDASECLPGDHTFSSLYLSGPLPLQNQ